MSGLDAGKLDREIVLLTATSEQAEGSGEDVLTWPDVDSVEDAQGVENAEVVWAEWITGTASEVWKASQRIGATVDGVFKIRADGSRPSPATTRILFDGTVYEVKGVTEIGRGDGWMISVSASGD